MVTEMALISIAGIRSMETFSIWLSVSQSQAKTSFATIYRMPQTQTSFSKKINAQPWMETQTAISNASKHSTERRTLPLETNACSATTASPTLDSSKPTAPSSPALPNSAHSAPAASTTPNPSSTKKTLSLTSTTATNSATPASTASATLPSSPTLTLTPSTAGSTAASLKLSWTPSVNYGKVRRKPWVLKWLHARMALYACLTKKEFLLENSCTRWTYRTTSIYQHRI